MNCSYLKAAAAAVVVAVLAATKASPTYFSLYTTPLAAGFLSSYPFLWIAANVIVVWLFSAYRQHNSTADSSSSASHASAMNSLYLSFEHDVYAPADAIVAPVLVSESQTREARTSKRTATDRPRVRQKSGGEEKLRALAGNKKSGEAKKLRAVAAEARPDGNSKPNDDEVKPIAVAAEAQPDDGDDVSMDSAWQSMLHRGTARPVAAPVRKSETWGGEELPRMQRAAEKAVARREMRKSATMIPPSPPRAAAAPAAARQGWRTRDVLGDLYVLFLATILAFDVERVRQRSSGTSRLRKVVRDISSRLGGS